MNRRALAAMLATATLVVGCARTRAALPPRANPAPEAVPLPATSPGPAEITPLEPIRASINQGKIPNDPSTVRASYLIEEPPGLAGDPAPPASGRPPAGSPPPAATPGRPAPPRSADPAPPEATPPANQTVAPPSQTAPAPDSPAPARTQVQPKAKFSADEAIGLKTDPGLEPGERAAKIAARVGGTVITDRMLLMAICNHLEVQPTELKEVPKDRFREIAKGTLENLIDNTLLLQEAQREMKKNWKLFSEFADKAWKDKEIPRKLRKYDAEDVFTLRKKMEARGDSLDDQQDLFKQDLMARDFLMIRLQPKVERPGKPEMEAYYALHRNDPKFHREARVTWREILLPNEAPADLPKARQSASAIRVRLEKGEEFAAIARSSSAGATAEKGGAWETSPGGHPVPAINAALGSMKIGEISAPIVGPKGVYLVRVERRTTSGPATFVEVQKQIAETLFHDRFNAMVEDYLKKLRTQTTITSPLLAGSPSSPADGPDPGKKDADTRRASGP